MSVNRRTPSSDRAGFSMLEMLVVLMIGAVLTGMAMSQVGRHLTRQGSTNSRDAFVGLAKRARSMAIERGRVVRLELDPNAERAWIVAGRSGDGDTLQILAFDGDYDADVRTSESVFLSVCYSPRGYALEQCTSITSPLMVRFTLGDRTAYALVRPLGQVDKR